eukprot:CAMPEP_0195081878 /NCGR_PEP_ID=MMETSP0448-20130528/23209_1 /TAXON_ID=66468 /ORGANISM="Heterocapsa triquestra, Strain CCMP 448" /LENGTH=656 /DNA_ID=CAMNT_0040114937 /DNA_START=40 /DNA_END=2010 /DNA_ORIENTATION=-
MAFGDEEAAELLVQAELAPPTAPQLRKVRNRGLLAAGLLAAGLLGAALSSAAGGPQRARLAAATGLSKDAPLSAAFAAVNAASPAFPGPRGKAKTALCISGGGARAFSNTLGVFRALEEIEVLPERVDAISSVSGGTWAAAQYMFAVIKPGSGGKENLTAVQLVGAPTDPAKLTMAALSQETSAMGATMAVNSTAIMKKLFVKDMGLCMVKRSREAKAECLAKKAAVAWEKVVGDINLGPYNLDCPDCYMAASQEAKNEIVAKNPSLEKAKWTIQRTDRPKTFVMSGSLLSPVGYYASTQNAVSLQMSPDFTGSPFYPGGSTVDYNATGCLRNTSSAHAASEYAASCGQDKRAPLEGVLMGGGLVETFAFGGTEAKFQSPVVTVQPSPTGPLSLQIAIGISSAAFVTAADFYNTTGILNIKMPYTAVPDASHNASEDLEERVHQMGDGGNLENLGLLAMLQSGASSLVSLVNTFTPLAKTSELDMCNVPPGTDLSQSTSNSSSSDLCCVFGYCTSPGFPYLYENNQVFASKDLAPLLCELQKLRDAGSPAVSRQKLVTVENRWWGIPAGLSVDVLWVYPSRVADFEKALPSDTQAELAKGDAGAFKNYPFYATMFQNGKESATNLNNEQVNLLAAQYEYVVKQNAALFKEVLLSEA